MFESFPQHILADARVMWKELHIKAARVADAPIVRQLSTSKDTELWIRYWRARLADANSSEHPVGRELTRFERFLQALMVAAERLGFPVAAARVRENFLQESQGNALTKEPPHWQMRNDFRIALSRLLPALLAVPLPPSVASDAYQRLMEQGIEALPVADRDAFMRWYGHFIMMETGLAYEYKQVYPALREFVPELNSHEILYVAHHAGHEDAHSREAFEGGMWSLVGFAAEEKRRAIRTMMEGGTRWLEAKIKALESY